MDPPIQDPYLLSWGPLAAISLNLMVEGVLILRSLLSRSLKPLRQVLPAQLEINQRSSILLVWPPTSSHYNIAVQSWSQVHITHANTGGDHMSGS